MDLVVGILLIIVAGIFTVTLSPILIMVGVMGGSDDPNVTLGTKILAWIVTGAGIVIPAALFFAGFAVLF